MGGHIAGQAFYRNVDWPPAVLSPTSPAFHFNVSHLSLYTSRWGSHFPKKKKKRFQFGLVQEGFWGVWSCAFDPLSVSYLAPVVSLLSLVLVGSGPCPGGGCHGGGVHSVDSVTGERVGVDGSYQLRFVARSFPYPSVYLPPCLYGILVSYLFQLHDWYLPIFF